MGPGTSWYDRAWRNSGRGARKVDRGRRELDLRHAEGRPTCPCPNDNPGWPLTPHGFTGRAIDVQDSHSGNPEGKTTIDALSVGAAQEQILRATKPLAVSIVPLDEALGMVLAQDVVAGHDNPPFDNSAMDGYACRAADIAGATRERPVVLPVMAEIVAGAEPAIRLSPGTAARIMTGAPVPTGADVVVPFEETDEGSTKNGTVGIQVSRPAHSNVRR